MLGIGIAYPLEYVHHALNGEMQAWVDAEDSLKPF